MKTTLSSLLFVLLFAPILMFGQTTVTGTVTEQSTAIPLPGVNILIKGTATGTATGKGLKKGNISLRSFK